MKRFIIIILTMIVVTVLSTWVLEKDHSAVPLQLRILIIVGGALLSGVLTFFLTPKNAHTSREVNK